MTRKYRNVHESYLTEFLMLNFPPGTWKTNVDLGNVKVPENVSVTPEEYRYLKRSFAATADAVVFLEDKVVIIEAMVRDEPGAIEDLLRYKKLFQEDTDFIQYRDKPIELWLVTPLQSPHKQKMAEEMGIKWVYYSPAWIWEYLSRYERKFWRGSLSSVET